MGDTRILEKAFGTPVSLKVEENNRLEEWRKYLSRYLRDGIFVITIFNKLQEIWSAVIARQHMRLIANRFEESIFQSSQNIIEYRAKLSKVLSNISSSQQSYINAPTNIEANLSDTSSSYVLLHRVAPCIARGAIHGLIFEFSSYSCMKHTEFVVIFDDGYKKGIVSFDGPERESTDNDLQKNMEKEWQEIEPGDYVVELKGRNLQRKSTFLCYELTMILAFGREISFSAKHEAWKGEKFSFKIPQPGLMVGIDFFQGKCIGPRVHKTSIHLPISRKNAEYLPCGMKHHLLFLLTVACRLDRYILENNGMQIGVDVWWNILGMLKGSDLRAF